MIHDPLGVLSNALPLQSSSKDEQNEWTTVVYLSAVRVKTSTWWPQGNSQRQEWRVIFLESEGGARTMSPRGQQSGCQRNCNPLTFHLSPKWPDLCPILMCLLIQSWNTTNSMSVAPGSITAWLIEHMWVWNQMWYQILALPRPSHGTYPHSGHDLKKILSQGFVLRITWET